MYDPKPIVVYDLPGGSNFDQRTIKKAAKAVKKANKALNKKKAERFRMLDKSVLADKISSLS